MDGRTWKTWALGVLAVWLWLWGLGICRDTQVAAMRTYYRLDTAITGERAEEIFLREGEKEEPVGVCFWGQQPSQEIQCRETGTWAEVTVVQLGGNPELLGLEGLRWEQGCYLDRQTAQRLFGTETVGGQKLWLGQKAYRVLGCLTRESPTLLVSAETGEEAGLNRCVLALPPEDGKGEAFLLGWELQGERIRCDGLWLLSYDLLLLFPAVVAGRLVKRGHRKLTKRAGLWAGRILHGCAWLGLMGVLWRYVRLPGDLLPSRWSDFSFWAGRWEQIRGNLYRLRTTDLGEGVLQMRDDMVKSIIASLLSAVLVAGTGRRRQDADTAGGG